MEIELVKKIFKLVCWIVILLNIMLLVGDWLIIINGYHLEYPRLFFGSLSFNTYIILFIISLLPLICSVVGLSLEYSKNSLVYTKPKIVFSIIGIVVSFFIALFSCLILLFIPPVESYTDSVANYLNIGSDLSEYDGLFNGFLPKEIPKMLLTLNIVTENI